MINALLVEDNAVALERLEHTLSQFPELHIVARCQDAENAMHQLSRQPTDLLFLDIELPGIDGLQLLEALGEDKPEVVITTAFEQYAVRAFEFNVLDFLLKPITPERMAKTLQRYRETKLRHRKALQLRPHLFIRQGQQYEKLLVEDIIWIEAFGDYSRIQTQQQRLVVYERIKNLEEALEEEPIIERVHRSFIVNLEAITSIEGNTLAIGERLIPVSKSRIKTVMKKLRFL